VSSYFEPGITGADRRSSEPDDPFKGRLEGRGWSSPCRRSSWSDSSRRSALGDRDNLPLEEEA